MVGGESAPYASGQMQGYRVKVVPFINAVRRYDSALEKKVYIQTKNADFKAEVEKAFPDKNAKIMAGVSIHPSTHTPTKV